MTPTLGNELRDEMERLLPLVMEQLDAAIRGTDERIALPPGAARALAGLDQPLPESGTGASDALIRLVELAGMAGGNTAGPKCFHFVIGGATPAAQAADLLATAHDAVTYTWVLSPVGVSLELLALSWLKELFGLPLDWPGIMVTGGTMANFTCLAAARQWWGEAHGRDVSETGMSGMPAMPVLTSGFVHASTLKVLAVQGVGRGNVRRFTRDDFGRVDLRAMRRALEKLEGRPALMVINAGEVNAGEFDPVNDMVGLAREHNCWVHVDGAFGLFARVSPRTAHLVEGVERADSVSVDGHKWLNVPYDSGFAFVRDHGLLARAFRYSADYLPPEGDPRPTPGAIGPESSRRARSFAVWATLQAYGRRGQQRIVEHCLDIAQYLAKRIGDVPELELMNGVQLNIVPFRYNPGNLGHEDLDDLNRRLGEAVLADGRFLVGTSRLGARTIFRPAFSNWRTRQQDIDEFVDVILELGGALQRVSSR